MKFWFAKETTSAVDGHAEPSADKPTAGAVSPSAVLAVDPVAAQAAVSAAVPKAAEEPEKKVEPSVVPANPAPAAPSRATAQVNQRDLYCNLMNALYDAVLVLDDKGHVVDSNERVQAIFGYSQDDMWDRPASDVVRGFGPQLLARLSEPLREHRPVIIDGVGKRRDGTSFQAEIAVGSVRLARGENIVLSIRDVGKRLAAALERARGQRQAADGAAKKPAVVRLAAHKTETQGA